MKVVNSHFISLVFKHKAIQSGQIFNLLCNYPATRPLVPHLRFNIRIAKKKFLNKKFNMKLKKMPMKEIWNENFRYAIWKDAEEKESTRNLG